MTVVEIRFQVPEQTVSLESRRCPATMSEDDLEWCFGGEVDFVDAESRHPLLSLETSLLGLAEDFSQVVARFRADGIYEIPDRYGSYRLVFTLRGDNATVRDEATSRAFEAESSQLISAMLDFAENLTNELMRLFPELSINPEFIRMSQEMKGRFSAA